MIILQILFLLLIAFGGGFILTTFVINTQRNKAKNLYNKGKIDLDTYRLIKKEILKEVDNNEQ
jgi:hypothetical protein